MIRQSRGSPSNWILWQWSSLDWRFGLSRASQRISTTIFDSTDSCLPRLIGLLLFWARVVVRDLNSDLSSVFALAVQSVPQVILAAAWNYDLFQINPGLPNQIRLFVIIED
jgi:hypothetical protein